MTALARDVATLLADMESERAADAQHGTALTFYDGRTRVSSLSRVELCRAAEKTAYYLATEAGVRRGERIAILASNRMEVPVVVLALLRLGAVVVPLNPNAGAEEWRHALINSGARGILCSQEHLERASAAVSLDFALELSSLLHAAERSLPHKSGLPLERDCFADDPAVLLYTSGTTGSPKGVCLPQAALVANARGMARRFCLERTTQLATLPLYHAHAFGFGLLSALVSGGHLVFTSKFDPFAWAFAARAEGVEVASVVPSLLRPLEDARLKQTDVPKLRSLLVSSAPLRPDYGRMFEETTGIPLFHGWGLSEYTNFACSLGPMTENGERQRLLYAGEAPSVGTSLDGTEVMAVGSDGRALPDLARGELVVRGPCTMLGYWGDGVATRAAIRDGWLHTGDEGYSRLEATGERHWFITGRLKEIIIRGGDKFSPLAIEAQMVAAASALDGRVVVLGFPHEVYGEEIGVYVEDATDDGALAALALAATASVAEGARPKVVLFGFGSVPRTHTGKVQRRSMVPLFAPYAAIRGARTIVRPSSDVAT